MEPVILDGTACFDPRSGGAISSMTTFLAYTTFAIALGLQTRLMWRLDQKAGRGKCEFVAFAWTMVILMLEGTLLRFAFPNAAAATPHAAFWAFTGNLLFYRAVGLAGLKEDDRFITKYDVYEWMFGGGLIGLGLLVTKYMP